MTLNCANQTLHCLQATWTRKNELLSSAQHAAMDLHWAIVNVLFYTNSSINFFLYTISASRFRREFWAFTTCTTTTNNTKVTSQKGLSSRRNTQTAMSTRQGNANEMQPLPLNESVKL